MATYLTISFIILYGLYFAILTGYFIFKLYKNPALDLDSNTVKVPFLKRKPFVWLGNLVTLMKKPLSWCFPSLRKGEDQCSKACSMSDPSVKTQNSNSPEEQSTPHTSITVSEHSGSQSCQDEGPQTLMVDPMAQEVITSDGVEGYSSTSSISDISSHQVQEDENLVAIEDGLSISQVTQGTSA